jgi:hypothetical protein
MWNALIRRGSCLALGEAAAPEEELVGARWWTEHFDEMRVEDHVVETEDRPVGEVTHELLRRADWLP